MVVRLAPEALPPSKDASLCPRLTACATLSSAEASRNFLLGVALTDANLLCEDPAPSAPAYKLVYEGTFECNYFVNVCGCYLEPELRKC